MMCIYIYIYIHIIHTYTYIYIYIYICSKRVLEYGARAPVFYENIREQAVFHEYLQEACFVLAEISDNLRKPPGVYGRM